MECIVRSNHKVKLSSNSYLILKQPAQKKHHANVDKGESHLAKGFLEMLFKKMKKEPVWPSLSEKSAVQCYRSRDSFEHLGKAWLLPLWASAARGDRGIFHPTLFGQQDILITTNYQTYKNFGVAKNCVICHFSHQLN